MLHALGTVEFSFENNQTKSPVTLKGFYMYGISCSRSLFALNPPFRNANTCLYRTHGVSFNVTLSHHKRASIKALIQPFFTLHSTILALDRELGIKEEICVDRTEVSVEHSFIPGTQVVAWMPRSWTMLFILFGHADRLQRIYGQ